MLVLVLLVLVLVLLLLLTVAAVVASMCSVQVRSLSTYPEALVEAWEVVFDMWSLSEREAKYEGKEAALWCFVLIRLVLLLLLVRMVWAIVYNGCVRYLRAHMMTCAMQL